MTDTDRETASDARTRNFGEMPNDAPRLDIRRSVMVTIGIDRYEHWSELSCAVNDASAARAAFATFGFEDAVPPLHNEAATRHALMALVTDGLRMLSEDDQLVVFYAGHGGTRTERPGGKEAQTGYLIPVDAAHESENATSWIDLGDWLRRIALLPPRHILVILDSCHSGIALHPAHRWRGPHAPGRAPLATLHSRMSRRVITSALDNQLALDNGPRTGNSLFTGCLIDLLETGHTAGLGLTGSGLGSQLQAIVSKYPGVQQTPDFGAFDRDERGELVFWAGNDTATLVEVAAPGRAHAPSGAIRHAGPVAPRSTWRMVRPQWRWAIGGIVFWILFLIGNAFR